MSFVFILKQGSSKMRHALSFLEDFDFLPPFFFWEDTGKSPQCSHLMSLFFLPSSLMFSCPSLSSPLYFSFIETGAGSRIYTYPPICSHSKLSLGKARLHKGSSIKDLKPWKKIYSRLAAENQLRALFQRKKEMEKRIFICGKIRQ